MNFQQFCSILKENIQALPFDKRLAFANAINKKLFFDYQEFYEEESFGNPDLLLDAINLIENSHSNTLEQESIKQLMLDINQACPDMDDFGGNAAYSALNSCAAVYETLEFLIDKNSQHIYEVGLCLINTVDSKIQEEDELNEEEINNHPVMIEAREYLLDLSK